MDIWHCSLNEDIKDPFKEDVGNGYSCAGIYFEWDSTNHVEERTEKQTGEEVVNLCVPLQNN